MRGCPDPRKVRATPVPLPNVTWRAASAFTTRHMPRYLLLHTPLPCVVQRSAACPSARSPQCDKESLWGVIALLFLPNAGHPSLVHPVGQSLYNAPSYSGTTPLPAGPRSCMSKNVLSFPSGGSTRSETPVVSWPRSTDGVSLATLLLKGVGKPERKQQKRVAPSPRKPPLPLTTPAETSSADHFFFSWFRTVLSCRGTSEAIESSVTQSAS